MHHVLLCDKISGEALHVKVCKLILGVHRKASNHAVRGELGSYPLLLFMFAWDKPNILSKSTISKNALEKMHSVYEADWLSIISSNTSKLRTYCKFKPSFCKENYVDFFHRVARSSLTDYV